MNKNIFVEYQNQYSISKTLRNELIPCGNTLASMEKNGVISEDEERAESYKKVKKLIDEYHKEFISESLKNIEIPSLDEYYALYQKAKDNESKKKIDKLSELMRKYIVKHIKSNPKFHTLFSKELITKDMHKFLKGKESEFLLDQFSNFSTYFTNFHENRKNMYDHAEKSTAIAYRIINQNLPKFIDNMKVFEIYMSSPISDKLSDIEAEYGEFLKGKSIKDYFSLDSYNTTITNEQITLYNTIIGGIAEDDKKHIQGLNQHINLYNQKHSKNKEFKKIPKFNMLYKQILADKESFSLITDQFESDQELIDTVNSVVKDLKEKILHRDGISSVFELMYNIDTYDLGKIYISNGLNITNISNSLYKDWSIIKKAIEEDYDSERPNGKKDEKYYEKRSLEIKKKKYFSIKYLNNVVGKSIEDDIPIENYFIEFKNNEGIEYYDVFVQAYNDAEELLNSEYYSKYGLKGDKKNVRILKNLLDALKNIEQFIKPLLVNGEESDIDYGFYGELDEMYNQLSVITPLYNKVRNYVTRKPYSTEKIKLNFGNPEFLGGWPVKREIATSGLIFKDDKFYYLGVIAKGQGKNFKEYPLPENSQDMFYKMEYLQAADPQKDVQNLMVIDGKTVKKNGRKEKSGEHAGENLELERLKEKYLPEDINKIRKNRSYSKLSENFNKEDLTKFIEYYMQRTIEYFEKFRFNFKEAKDYVDFGEFTDHVNAQAYQLKFVQVSKKHIDNLVDAGKLYLFKIFNKDFSEFSKGTPNLHTVYLKMLFDERNLANVVYKLNGEAEVFYRKASIDDDNKVIHPKGEPVANKNPKVIEKKVTSLFDYDLIKDKRYSVDKFQLHMPITLNFSATGNDRLNSKVLQTIRDNEDIYVIGIDRGERNLLYISVIDSDGKIVKQESMNIITNDNDYEQNYHKLLEEKEKGREAARINWNTVETIKELKEGYLSQVIHKVVEYMLEYNAIVVLEDLNSGFKNSRKKVEKQVYQKFEKMLIDKLNYLVDKKKNVEELGGALHAYQLTSKFESFAKLGKQSGFLFYIPSWNTSKIDPTTGFVSLIHFKYTSVNDAKDKISKFKKISYNDNYFEFEMDYRDFTEKATGTKTEWTLCSYGERIINFRNPEINNMWDSKEINLTDKIMKLFLKYNIDVTKENLIDQIILIEEKKFYEEILQCMNLILQIRNSKTNSDIDYMISPVKNENGEFFDTRKYDKNSYLPCDADANGAYNIARKGLWLIEQIRSTEGDKVKMAITNKEWLSYAQDNVVL